LIADWTGICILQSEICNLPGLRTLIRGHLVADVVALIGSLDVVLGEVDR